ncbi:hypothetical protein ACP4OV_010736 [Aristida adscensionis]
MACASRQRSLLRTGPVLAFWVSSRRLPLKLEEGGEVATGGRPDGARLTIAVHRGRRAAAAAGPGTRPATVSGAQSPRGVRRGPASASAGERHHPPPRPLAAEGSGGGGAATVARLVRFPAGVRRRGTGLRAAPPPPKRRVLPPAGASIARPPPPPATYVPRSLYGRLALAPPPRPPGAAVPDLQLRVVAPTTPEHRDACALCARLLQEAASDLDRTRAQVALLICENESLRYRLKRAAADEAASGGGGAGSVGLRCQSCRARPATVVLVPRNHLCLCAGCSAAGRDDTAMACPVCRDAVGRPSPSHRRRPFFGIGRCSEAWTGGRSKTNAACLCWAD